MDFPETLTIADLPEDVFGGRGEGESLADIMSQVTNSRVGSECGDVYADEVYAMNAYAAEGNATVRFGKTTVWHTPDRGRTQNQRKIKSGIVRPIHPKVFGPSRAVGSTFGPAPLLPRRELTIWEQERAASPERSHPPSAMTCVRRYHGEQSFGAPSASLSHRSVSVPSTPSRSGAKQWGSASDHHASSNLVHQRLEVPGTFAHKNAARSLGRTLPNMHRCDEVGDAEILIPVRLSAPTASQPRLMTNACRGAQSATHVGTRAAQECAVEVDECDERDLGVEEVRKLQARRRHLISELNHTDQRLKDELAAASQSDGEMSFQPSPGGGGGAPFRQKYPPSAGGPFAGRRAANDHTVHTKWNQSLSDIAGTSYSYLGPGSDGPPLPEIHPLWS